MGVWSSISSCSFDRRKIRHSSPGLPNSCVKQIVNIDSDNFSHSVLQDVKEIRIQESQFENFLQHSGKDEKKNSLHSSEYFEYSMGGNLKFYKEHIQHDLQQDNKVHCACSQGKRQRRTSHSDNDSEPESQRYCRKPSEKTIHVVNTIAEEPELSFDDYSTIYQPEFVLNINSQSLLVNETPKVDEKANEEETKSNLKKKDRSNIPNLRQDFLPTFSSKKIENNDAVNSKLEGGTASKQNVVVSNRENMLPYHSSIAKEKQKSEEEEKCKSIKYKKEVSINKKANGKPRKTVKIPCESILNFEEGKNITLSYEKATFQKRKEKNKKTSTKVNAIIVKANRQRDSIANVEIKHSTSKNVFPPEKHNKEELFRSTVFPREKSNESQVKIKKLEMREKSKKMTETTDFVDKKHDQISFKNENTLSKSRNYQTTSNSQESISSRLSMDTTAMFVDNVDFLQELGMVNAAERSSEPTKTSDVELYPEYPISELHFFKTPCSTRHNSLETFEMLENECVENFSEQKPEILKENATNLLPVESYKTLPREFQEMARRLSKRAAFKKSLSSHTDSAQDFNCSSSTCSTNSPRSPSGRKLFRTPSYKMPKTPSLSRQHPSTYVTQHTSSRSRPSSRVSSRATSPTREHIEALL